MDPEAISGLEVWDFSNRKCCAGALYANVDLGTDQVKRRIIGARSSRQNEQKGKKCKKPNAEAEEILHRSRETHYSPFRARFRQAQ